MNPEEALKDPMILRELTRAKVLSVATFELALVGDLSFEWQLRQTLAALTAALTQYQYRRGNV